MNPYVKHLLSDSEAELSETHQHPFWLIGQIWLLLTILLAILVIIIFSQNFSDIGAATGEHRANNIWWMLLLVALVPLAIIAVYYIRWRNHIFVVTNRRVITLSGVINKASYDIALEKINDISTGQSLFGRMFNFGDVTLESGNDEPVLMHGIASPLEFKKALLDAKSGMFDAEMGRTRAVAGATGAPTAGNPGVPPVVTASANGGSRNSSALRELEDLRSQGLITDAEYAQKRAEILRRM